MKTSFFILILMFLMGNLSAQKKDPEHYSYPFSDSYQPLKIRLNIIVLQRNDGTGNFNLKDPEEKKLLLEYVEFPNYVFSNFENPPDLKGCYTGNDFIKDAKIRFEINLVEVKNTYFWDLTNSGADPENKKLSGFSPTENWYMKALDDSIKNSNIPKGINVYLPNNGNRFDDIVKSKGKTYDLSGEMASQLPNSRNLERSSQINLANLYPRYIAQRYKSPIDFNTTWAETKNWWINAAFAHEIGHSLGLNHSNEYYSANKCQYSLMSQKYNHPKNWLPPTEIKKMHWNLTQTNLMQFVTPESHYGVSWPIKENTEWKVKRRFYNDFEVAPNVSLTISETIILPPNAQFILNKGSQLIFKGNGKLIDANGRDFKNIIKNRKAKILYQ